MCVCVLSEEVYMYACMTVFACMYVCAYACTIYVFSLSLSLSLSPTLSLSPYIYIYIYIYFHQRTHPRLRTPKSKLEKKPLASNLSGLLCIFQ